MNKSKLLFYQALALVSAAIIVSVSATEGFVRVSVVPSAVNADLLSVAWVLFVNALALGILSSEVDDV